jgi:hypothetical protein
MSAAAHPSCTCPRCVLCEGGSALPGCRAAQKAFRARKKEREAAKEAQLAELSSRLAALEVEKRALVARNVLLERAVAASGVAAPGSAPGSPGSAPPPATPPAQVRCAWRFSCPMEGPCSHPQGL